VRLALTFRAGADIMGTRPPPQRLIRKRLSHMHKSGR